MLVRRVLPVRLMRVRRVLPVRLMRVRRVLPVPRVLMRRVLVRRVVPVRVLLVPVPRKRLMRMAGPVPWGPERPGHLTGGRAPAP